jgi:phosphoglycerol transferase MdoB-like AlkP superfamily enzyme
MFLGEVASLNEWDTWTNKRNIYETFSDTRKSLQTSGFYEYIMRDIYLSKIAVLFENHEEDIAYLDNYFKSYNKDAELKVGMNSTASDDLKGIFKDKNVIVVLMESIDDWMINEEMMPNLKQLMAEGINFTNHYAPIYGGGATFNSEFMLNTGYMTPLNGETASNKYGHNYFPYSLPNLLADSGYTVNSFHQNVSSFYNRGQMSRAFGYENYYSSVELGVPYSVATNDTHFLTSEKIRNLLLPNRQKFMDLIITYSAHTSYSLDEGQCRSAVTKEELAQIRSGSNEEEICLKAQTRETDNFFKELINALEDENKINDTIIIGVTDHYAYGYSNREKLYALKGSDDLNLISKLPFFIWGSDIPSYEVAKVNSNIDILPTLAYLFGLDYDPKYYIGNNIFDPDYEGFVFFSDYSWYGGDVYYKNNQVIIGDEVDQKYIDNRNKQLNTILDINKKVLETDYFSTMSSD